MGARTSSISRSTAERPQGTIISCSPADARSRSGSAKLSRSVCGVRYAAAVTKDRRTPVHGLKVPPPIRRPASITDPSDADSDEDPVGPVVLPPPSWDDQTPVDDEGMRKALKAIRKEQQSLSAKLDEAIKIDRDDHAAMRAEDKETRELNSTENKAIEDKVDACKDKIAAVGGTVAELKGKVETWLTFAEQDRASLRKKEELQHAAQLNLQSAEKVAQLADQGSVADHKRKWNIQVLSTIGSIVAAAAAIGAAIIAHAC